MLQVTEMNQIITYLKKQTYAYRGKRRGEGEGEQSVIFHLITISYCKVYLKELHTIHSSGFN